ncbi:hypothetical protein C6370_12390 [Bacillus atrophaeus]|nr:hypothetical protein C6370_12390 [Bacillus atrophaeus]
MISLLKSAWKEGGVAEKKGSRRQSVDICIRFIHKITFSVQDNNSLCLFSDEELFFLKIFLLVSVRKVSNARYKM